MKENQSLGYVAHEQFHQKKIIKKIMDVYSTKSSTLFRLVRGGV